MERLAAAGRALRPAAAWLFWALLLYFGIRFVVPHWESLRVGDRLRGLRVEWLLAAFAATFLYYLAAFGLWTRLVYLLGACPPRLLLYRAYALSHLPKYVPGKVLAYGARLRWTMQAGVPAPAAAASLLWEGVWTLGGAVALSLLSWIHPPPGWPVTALRGLMLLFLVGLALLAVAARWSRLGRAWTGAPHLWERRGAAAALALLYVALWFLPGLAHWCLARAMAPVPFEAVVLFTLGFALAWGLGVASIVAPAGLGVRDVALYLLLRPALGDVDALLLVTLSRLTFFSVEAILALSWPVYRVVARTA